METKYTLNAYYIVFKKQGITPRSFRSINEALNVIKGYVLCGSMVETLTPDTSALSSNPGQDVSFTGGSLCNRIFIISLVLKVNCAQS